MSYNCKNYTEQGGEKTVIDGTVFYKGTEIKPAANMAALSAAPTKENFNALLAALKTAGLMAADS